MELKQFEIDFFNTIQATEPEVIERANHNKKGVDRVLDLMRDGKERTWFEVKAIFPEMNECSIKRTLSTRCTKIKDKLKMGKSPSGVNCHRYKI